MTELEKLQAGLEYNFVDPELNAHKLRANALCEKLNALPTTATAEREALIAELFGSVGAGPRVLPAFHCDDGKNIHAGDQLFINYNVTILDRAEVTIGDNAVIAPGVLITTVNHAMTAKRRRENYCTAKPIRIGNDVWLGGNCVILPGVTLGDNVIVAAGAVVTRDIPSNSLAAGVPARVIRSLESGDSAIE